MNVLLYGYYGMRNTGDDAFLAVTAWGARRFIGAEKVRALTSSIPRFRGSEAVHAVYTRNPRFKGENRLRYLMNIFRSDAVLFGGGSIFHTRGIIEKQIGIVKRAGKGPHAALGVSIGPFRDQGAERACAELLKRLSYVGLREHRSLEIARSLAPDTRSERTFDLAALLGEVEGRPVGSLATSQERSGIGIALLYPSTLPGGENEARSHLLREVASAVDLCGDRIQDPIHLIDFSGADDGGDRFLHEELAASLKNKVRIEHIPYCDSPMTTLERIAKLKVLIAMRLHAAVFGYLTMTPTVVICYHRKCYDWAQEVGAHEQMVLRLGDLDGELLAARIMSSYEHEPPMPSLPLEEAKRKAMKNWTWLQRQS